MPSVARVAMVSTLAVLSLGAWVEPADAQAEVRFTRAGPTIGTFDGPGAIGEVTDLTLLPDGRIAILDRLASDVKVFSSDGEFLFEIGRAGQGPGEFNWPSAVTTDSDGDLLVLDAGNRRLSVFSVGAASSQLAEERGVDFVAHDMCLIGDRIFLLGLYEGAAIHVLSDEESASSFDRFPRVGTGIEAMEQRHEATGYLVCDEFSQRLAVVPLIRADIRLYGSDGSKAGEVILPGYHLTTLVQIASGSIQLEMDPESGTVHEALGAVGLSGLIVLQTIEKDLTGPIGEPQTWLIDEDGQLLQAAGPSGAIRLVAGDVAYVASEMPFPQVQTWRISRN